MGGVRPIFYTIYLLAYPVPSSAKQHLEAPSLLRARCPHSPSCREGVNSETLIQRLAYLSDRTEAKVRFTL